MSTFDFVVGIRVGEFHSRTLKFERVEMNDEPKEIYNKLALMIVDVVDNSPLEVPNRNDIRVALGMIDNTLRKSNFSLDDLDTLDDCFDVISYLGLEADAFRRDEIVYSEAEVRSVMGYVVNSKLEGRDTRISSALGLFTEDVSRGSLSDIVMEAFKKIRLDSTLEDLIHLPIQLENYDTMVRVNAGGNLDTTRLRTLLHDMGWEIKIFVN